MQTEITVTFDEQERLLFDTIASPSILGGPALDDRGAFPRVRLVRRAAEGQPLRAVELAALKQMLEESIAEREANVGAARDAHNPDLADGFQTWIPALSGALALTGAAETAALGGAA